MSRQDPARLAALECVEAVDADGGYANLVMPRILAAHRLSGRDAGFATELAYGALRMHGLYDAIIAKAAGRPIGKVDPAVRRILWLGVHQLLGMRVPSHAAVSETVSLARGRVGVGPSKFVNAVLRRVSEATREAWIARVAPGSGRDAVALRESHPAWVAAELERALAADGRRGELAALLEADNAPARVTLVARPGLADPDELMDEVPGAVRAAYAPTAVVLAEGGEPGAVAAVRERRAAVQDEGSQVVASALVAVDGVQEGERWLDLCAGPGGKTALLGAFAAPKAATLDAVELHEHRARLVEDSVKAVPAGTVAVSVGDGTTWGEPGAYDRVLLDAPCTGLGALRRRPEARWRKSKEDLADLEDLQARLLERALTLVKPGGLVAYVTCSPLVGETHDVVAGARGATQLDARDAVARATATAPDQWGAGPHVQLWTHAHGTDSMFLALLRRDEE
ncbi:RsmB/NOP family class I SAM-dependent RNA methyltransferase [Demequina zhanjiangensis]|uniref:Transcription antitermination factor NusB n=1 Tax=Demequina zhanjiangensis TaxID=3051659 RepID=A0ABT8G2F3_9MICO|nr:transcription antitermination factor NusB [Demequina sp. SYSU T00b26]MDN4473326.1 transcription antitermination factor NusB [Demequina sp. SYSU T00b26]